MIIDGLEKTNSLKVFRLFFDVHFILFLISAFIYAMSVTLTMGINSYGKFLEVFL